MSTALPQTIVDFQKEFPQIWEAFAALGERCHEQGGPLDEKTRRLVKMGIAIATRHEGAVHSAVRHAIETGVTREEMLHVAMLAITTVGWPAAYAAMTWIEEIVRAAQGAETRSVSGRRATGE